MAASSNSTPFNSIDVSVPSVGADRLTLVNGRTFTVAQHDGMLRAPSDGTVFEDLRMIARLEFWVAAGPDEPAIARQQLARATPTPFEATVVSRPDPMMSATPTSEMYVHRQWIGRGVRHDVEVHNTGNETIRRTVSLQVATDFAHLFDMKEGAPGPVQAVLRLDVGEGVDAGPDHVGDLVDPDDSAHRVLIECSPPPTTVSGEDEILQWSLECPPRTLARVAVTFEPAWDGVPAGLLFPLGSDPAHSRPTYRLRDWREAAPRVISDDARLDLAMDTSLADLASLRIFDPDHPTRTVVAAGAPWFMTLFGRDSLLTSWMVLPFAPELALGVLRALAELQGQTTTPATEEQPGKIIHELRRHGGDDAFAERGRYYGTVDATPLFVMLAAEAHRWGHLDTAGLLALWPHVRAAVAWTRTHIARDPGGFVNYQRSTPTGLVNQGWKDSWDGISCADGTIPEGPIALAEVQGYAYAALIGGAHLARQLADPGLDPGQLETEASDLRQRFEDAFWNETQSAYLLGVAGDGSAIDSVTTNPGHAIWAGITDDDRASRYLDRCMDGDLWSGWGLRTLSPTSRRYDPLSYHNGSVWPHDTAIVAAGASRIGRMDVVARIVDAQLDLAALLNGRPPELFAGVHRDVVTTPVAYPSSCSPQAWAAASTLLHLRSSLRLGPPTTGAPTVGVQQPAVSFHQLVGVRVGADRFRVVSGDSISVVADPA